MYSFRDLYPNMFSRAATAERTIPEAEERASYYEAQPANEPEAAVKAPNIWAAFAALVAFVVLVSALTRGV